MAIPAWRVLHALPLGDLESTDNILEDFIQGMANMEAAIGVWGTIMKNEWLRACSFGLPGIEVIGTFCEIWGG
jgi:hypothetical protein